VSVRLLTYHDLVLTMHTYPEQSPTLAPTQHNANRVQSALVEGALQVPEATSQAA